MPSNITGASYADENGDPQIRTWLEWINAGRIEYKDNGTLAVFKSSWNGITLDSDDLGLIHATQANVIEWDDLIARSNSLEYNPE